jgi:hypothetical protein
VAGDQKHALVRFLETHAFEPVLRAKPDGRSAADQKTLAHVQQATRAEIDRLRHYPSAQEVVTNVRRDLTSAPAKRVHRELRRLGLPTLDDIRDDFERRAEALEQGLIK